MIRGTTPSIMFKLKDMNVSTIYNFYITFTQNGKVIFEKSKDSPGVSVDEDENTITADLTVDETLSFKADEELISQVMVITIDGKVGSTDKYYFDVEDSLHYSK